MLRHSCTRKKTNARRPLLCVGILTIPSKGRGSHLLTSYVDWFEQRGVRVIPIPYDTTEVDAYFSMVNGLVIPGGDMPHIMQYPVFLKTVTRFFELSLQPGEYFPIWGTCFGFELLLFLVGGFTTRRTYDAHGSYPLTIAGASRMMKGYKHSPVVFQNHLYGISPEDFEKNAHVRRFFSIVATAVDDAGKTYVAAMEGRFYPVYGVQFHPELTGASSHQHVPELTGASSHQHVPELTGASSHQHVPELSRTNKHKKSSTLFLDFLLKELRMNRHKVPAGLPHMETYVPQKKCEEYREAKKVACYVI